MGMRPDPKTGNPGRTHRFYTGTPVFKYGEGLRYTTFSSAMGVQTITTEQIFTLADQESRKSLTHFTATKVAQATVNVTNTGDMAGDEVVLLFGAPPKGIAGQNGNPIQNLVAYERVTLQPGETTRLALPITTNALKLTDKTGAGFTAHGDWEFWVGVRSEVADADVATLAL
jgi:hypothetical protein